VFIVVLLAVVVAVIRVIITVCIKDCSEHQLTNIIISLILAEMVWKHILNGAATCLYLGQQHHRWFKQKLEKWTF
jgi:hypothetical protein